MFITTPDGTRLVVEGKSLPSPRARVVITHGYAEHSGRYSTVMSELAAERFESHIFDLRGHGHSGGTPAHVDRFSNYLDDLRYVIEHVRNEARGDAPLIVLGHSLGGLIVLHFARGNPPPCDALVVSSPYLRPAFHIPTAKRILARGASLFAPTLEFANLLDPAWLSTDLEVGKAYARDPLVLRTTTPRWFTEVERAQHEIREHAPEITLPLLMLLGEEDHIADPAVGKELFASLGSKDKTLKVYSGLRHEVFNELRRDIVVADLLAWLRERFIA